MLGRTIGQVACLSSACRDDSFGGARRASGRWIPKTGRRAVSPHFLEPLLLKGRPARMAGSRRTVLVPAAGVGIGSRCPRCVADAGSVESAQLALAGLMQAGSGLEAGCKHHASLTGRKSRQHKPLPWVLVQPNAAGRRATDGSQLERWSRRQSLRPPRSPEVWTEGGQLRSWPRSVRPLTRYRRTIRRAAFVASDWRGDGDSRLQGAITYSRSPVRVLAPSIRHQARGSVTATV